MQELAELVEQAAQRAQEQNLLPSMALPDSIIEHPQNPEHGDYASSLPLKLARAARMNPMAIAQTIYQFLPASSAVERISVAPPGFINFTLKQQWLAQQVEAILKAGASYGTVDVGNGARVQLEFVSANPTGPLHVGNGRGAILGSALANVLQAAGFQVEQEYYINDAGSQMEVFRRSLWARYLECLGQEVDFPQDGYGGDYLRDLAREIVGQEGDRFLGEPRQEKEEALARTGIEKMLAAIRHDLEDLGVHYDVWFSEKSLYQGDAYDQAMALLAKGGYVVEKEGARWFVSTALGEDKDNVLVRTSGVPTYFASDAAYHYNKFVERGFQRVIDIWGADHQGHVSRVKAVVGALGVELERLQVLITQMVTLKRGPQVVRLSKRAGDIVTLREVLDEVGVDACRFFFLARSADSQMDFDLELAKRQSSENPVYYVQYAHARIASLLHNAQERELDWSEGDVLLLTHDAELALIRKMLLLPELVEAAALTLAPHNLPHYAQELATVFHNFYEQCRIITDDAALTAARLKLVEAVKIVLARTLSLMGMSAPDRMER